MDIIGFLIENESSILIVISSLLAICTRYFQNQSKILYAAGQAIVDLESAFLEDIKDGVVTKEEADALLVKVEAAKEAILEVVDLFTKPTTMADRVNILLGTSGVESRIESYRAQTQTMRIKKG